MSKKKDKKKKKIKDEPEEKAVDLHYDEDGHVRGTVNPARLWKRIKKFFKRIYYKIIWFFNKQSDKIPYKWRKRFIKEYLEKIGVSWKEFKKAYGI